MGVYTTLLVYLSFVMPVFFKMTMDEADAHAPKVIPACAISGIIIFVTTVLALMPVWGFTTIPILILLFVGYTMTSHFLPGGYFGSFCMIALLALIVSSYHFIEHTGEWHYDDAVQEITAGQD